MKIVSGILSFLWRAYIILFSSPLTALVLTALSIVVALTGSLSTNSLKCSWPLFNIVPSNTCASQISIFSDVILVGFWVSLICFCFIFLNREISVAVKAHEKEIKLIDTVRTMPPSDIMPKYAALYRNILLYIEENVKENQPPAEKDIDNAIRLSLAALTSLVSSFHQKMGRPRYAANIMTYVSLDSIAESDRESIQKGLMRFTESQSFEGIDGVLWLQGELSSSTDNETGEMDKDPHLENDIAIPIPDPNYSAPSGRPRFLPGAAAAFMLGDHSVEDTHALLEQYEESNYWNEIPRSVFEKIDRYFKENAGGKKVRSFISIRISNSPTENALPLGVVTIHCDERKLFVSDWAYESFLALAAPITWQISELLKLKETAYASSEKLPRGQNGDHES